MTGVCDDGVAHGIGSTHAWSAAARDTASRSLNRFGQLGRLSGCCSLAAPARARQLDRAELVRRFGEDDKGHLYRLVAQTPPESLFPNMTTIFFGGFVSIASRGEFTSSTNPDLLSFVSPLA